MELGNIAPEFTATGRRNDPAVVAISVEKRNLFGHHPHGLDPDKTVTITEFFAS